MDNLLLVLRKETVFMKYKALNTTQKVFCILLTIFVLFSSIAMIPTQVYAEPSTSKHYIIYQYSNGEISNDKIKFVLYSTDVYFPTQANNKAVSVRAYSFFGFI